MQPIKKLLNDKHHDASMRAQDRLNRDIRQFNGASYENALREFYDWLKLYLDFVDDEQLEQGYFTINAETCPNIVYSILRTKKFIDELSLANINVEFNRVDYLGRKNELFKISF